MTNQSMTDFYYAHEGCYLAFPDIGFDSGDAPFVDLSVLESDAALLRQEIEGAAALGCKGFVHLMNAVDDFVAYQWLDHPDAARRETRAEALSHVMRPLVELAHKLGMSYHIQTYELLFDREVAKRANRDNIRHLLEGKYREFFDRTGADGLFVTPSEAHPRGTTIWSDLWGGKAGAAEMAADFKEVIVQRLGKELVFRLWLMAETDQEWEALRGQLPPGLPLCVKNTASDFWNRVPLNPALRREAPGPLHVLFDVYGQYHGWGKLLYFDSLWDPALEVCAQSGATIQLWGSWAPPCIWPNDAPHDMTGPQPQSWAGRCWDLGLWQEGHLGGQLSMRWLMNRARGASSDQAMAQAAAAFNLAPAETEALQAALPLVMDLWDEMHTLHRGRLVPLLHQWATIYQSPRCTWREVLADGAREGILADNRRMESGVNALRAAGRAVSDPALRRTWDLTVLYFETFRLSREAACHDPRFAGGTGVDSRLLEALRDCLRQWASFSPENADWLITAPFSTRFPARKRWLRPETLAEYVEKLATGQTDPVPDQTAFAMETWNGR